MKPVRLSDFPGSRWEGAAATVLAAVALVVAAMLTGMGLGWDSLNHHLYLGWSAQEHRFDRDLVAAGYQAHLFPYSYWPAYFLLSQGVSGTWASACLALLHATVVPALWLIAWALIPGRAWSDLGFRWVGVALGLVAPVPLSMLGSTSNDMLSAVPFVWAIALSLPHLGPRESVTHPGVGGAIAPGLLLGVSVALKWSNGPLALVVPLLWALAPGSFALRVARVAAGCAATALGCLVLYAGWGYRLLHEFGNPIHPFYPPLGKAISAWMKWAGI